ncbi:MAG TPA: hypothetical protein VGH38_09820, partial [Bryobacteraceae bacterium]
MRTYPWSGLSLVLLLPAGALCDVQTTTQTLAVTVSAYGNVSIPGNVDLRSSNTRFGAFTGSLAVSYWSRTSDGGGGSVTIQANSDFSPSGGPTAGSVSYSCSGATLGT